MRVTDQRQDMLPHTACSAVPPVYLSLLINYLYTALCSEQGAGRSPLPTACAGLPRLFFPFAAKKWSRCLADDDPIASSLRPLIGMLVGYGRLSTPSATSM